MSHQNESRVQRNGLAVAESLFAFIENKALPGSGISSEEFCCKGSFFQSAKVNLALAKIDPELDLRGSIHLNKISCMISVEIVECFRK